MVLLQEKLCKHMRSLWEKSQENQRNLDKDGRLSFHWMVSMRLYFPLNQVVTDMLETSPLTI